MYFSVDNYEIKTKTKMNRFYGLVLIIFASCNAPKKVSEVPAPAQDILIGVSSLFNGKDLTGWKQYGSELWYVKDGEIVCESGPKAEYGYLATKDYYDDFELSVDFLQEADGNSGIFFRSKIEGTVINGWQVEVAPPGPHSGGIYESYGRGWLVQPDASKNDALKMGEWNTMLSVSVNEVV